MSNINEWVKDVKNNREEYAGLKEVKSILKKAYERGYNITEKELLDLNLGLISGGSIFGLDLGFNFNQSTHTTNVSNTTNNTTTNIDQTADVTGNNNSVTYINNNNIDP